MSNSSPSGQAKRLIGYFPSWAIHAMNYHVADVPAAQLTHVIYAFANVTAAGDCISTNADDDKVNFAQLHLLKQQHPNLQVLISIGGATNSTNFPTAVANPTILGHFAQSCVQFMKQNGFDGIDIDWEYPTAVQAQSFTALLTELRRQLDALGASDRRSYLLTIAAPAGAEHSAILQLDLIHPRLDWINLMSYDFTLASSTTTDFVAPLKAYDPSVAKHAASNADAAVQRYLDAGVPAAKLVLGTRFVGTGWQGVTKANNGLYQPNGGPAKGTWDPVGVPPTGNFGYQDLKQNYIRSRSRFWHADAGVPWVFDPATGVMISYEDPQSLGLKANYVLVRGLAGVMIWNLSADDSQHMLLSSLADGLGLTGDLATYTITGKVTSPDSASVGGLQVQLVDKVVGSDVPLGMTTTDAAGQYKIGVAISDTTLQGRQKARPDLQARVLVGQISVAASAVKYNASVAEVLDIVLPAGLMALPSEHETLTADLAHHFTGKLATLQETEQQQDITYLANKSGWDARAVALAALSEQFSQVTATTSSGATASLKPEFYYALFRAGFPANADSLFNASPAAVQSAWQLAIKQGVIPQALAGEVAGAVGTFQALSAAHILDAPPQVGPSSLRVMLQAGLPAITLEQQTTFSQLYVQDRNDPSALWTAVGNALGAGPAKQLQLAGQLFYLSLNNAPLVTALFAAEHQNPPSSTLDLATRGYHQAAKWLPLIGNSIPQQIAGTGEQQRNNYAQLLATHVRLSFPTAVVAERVQSGNFVLSNSAVTPDMVSQFLLANRGKFEIGIEPIEAYLQRSGLLATPTNLTAEIKRLQRVYQMTRDDETMGVLLHNNLDSAHAIMRYDQAGFVRAFQHKLGGAHVAMALHVRAKQIHSSALNVVVSYLSARIAPPIGGGQVIQYWPPLQNPTYPTVAFPTLENLFGSLDYCECQECRSILSPAAYLVDLLHYLDRPSPSPGFQNPQDVLLQRRPDLQYLPLTCENTNTALPYVDIVNEILEYFVANKLSLTNYQGHDTGQVVTSAELMASPQNVNDAAYAALQNASFPPPLPFNRPLELLRLHLQKMGVALPDLMAAFRTSNALERPTPTGYGWRDILMEQLGISRNEYLLFTDRTLGLQGLYGYPQLSDPAVLQVLQAISLRDYSRRTGVSYNDLFSIVGTRFISSHATVVIINPNPVNEADQCAASTLQFRSVDRNNNRTSLSATDFVKLIRFIRLWRKLALSIEQTDNLLSALYPAADMPSGADDAANLALLDSGSKVFLPRAGFLFQVMARLNLNADASLARVLACWAPIGTAGANALYRKMFLGPALSQDSVAQTATVVGPVDPGVQLITSINGVPITYTVQAADTSATIATNIATAINATTTVDPTTGLPLNSRVFAASQGTTIAITAGFTLGCTTSAGATEGFVPGLPTPTPPLQRTAIVSGTTTAGDVLAATINSVVIPYTVVAGDTPTTIANAIAAAINASATSDPFSGLPLNRLVLASSAAGTITVNAINSGAPFSLACTTTPGSTYAVTAAVPPSRTATISGAVHAGDTLVTTINGAALPYSAAALDTDAASLAKSIAAMINASTIIDPVSTTLPLNSIVSASSSGGVVMLAAKAPITSFMLACSVSTGAETYGAAGPFAASQTLTVGGSTAAGRVLITTINGVAVPCTVASGDTPSSIAANIASQINSTTAPDLVVGLPLNKVVSAAAGAGTISVTASDPTTMFTLTVATQSAAYVAGRALSPFADSGSGSFLQDKSQTMFGHEATLCAAFNLTGAEFALLVQELGFDANTPLTLENVSALFRHGWLAHTLAISVVEFLALRKQSGLDPLDQAASLDPAATPPTEPPVIRFIRLQQALTAAGLQPVQALYLIWNHDISGRSAPPMANMTGLARTLRADFAAVEAQFKLVADPDGSIAKKLMGLVYGSAATDFFFGMLNNTLATSVGYLHPQPTLAQPIIDASAGRLSYDDLHKQLIFAGVLDAATQATIDQAITANGNLAALHTALSQLATANHKLVDPFFAAYAELLPLYVAYVSSADPPQPKRNRLLASFLPTLKQKRKQEQALASITAAAGTDPAFATALLQNPAIVHAAAQPLLAAFTDLTAVEAQGLSARFFLANNIGANPDLTLDSCPPQLFMATIGGAIRAGDVLTTTLNGIAVPYAIVAADVSLPVLAGHVAAAINQTAALNQLVTASAVGAMIAIAVDPTAGPSFAVACSVSAGATETYAVGTGGSAIAVVWSGFIDVPQDGLYSFSAASDAGTLSLQVDGVAIAMGETISLTAGALVPIVLTATSLKTSLSLSWQSLGVGSQVVPPQYLYSATLVDRLGTTYVRLLKVTSLATALSVTANEVAYLARQPLSAIGPGWLNSLAISGEPDATTAAGLRDVLVALLDFTRMKQALSPGDERLLAVLQSPTQTNVPALTAWTPASMNALLARFFGDPQLAHLSSVENFRRVYDAYAIVRTCRISAAVLIAATTNAPSADTMNVLQSGLRARYAEPDWLTVLRPISDLMRISQRDALVAYVLQQLGDNPASANINTPDRLFEYFLVDVETQPAVETSRIRLALSSVQLFIERTLRNLEPQVWPSDIDGTLWPWMKRYRVWQANREVFLWPENWLYPELRDDQSPFFQQTMSALLQSDLTDDAAANAYLDYLSSLQDVAKLEPCGIYYVAPTSDADEISYVVARTAGATRKYYFRMLQNASWTPWAEIKIECEDMPITPIVWNGRLFLFWLKVLKQTAPQPVGQSFNPGTDPVSNWQLDSVRGYAAAGAQAQGQGSVIVQAVLHWCEYYNGKWQPAKTSDVNRPTILGSFDVTGPDSFDADRNLLQIYPINIQNDPLAVPPLSLPPGALVLAINSPLHAIPVEASFVLYNTHSLPILLNDIPLDQPFVDEVVPPSKYRWLAPKNAYTGAPAANTLSISYELSAADSSTSTAYTNKIVGFNLTPRYIEPQPDSGNPWDAPFFFEDRRNAFYVTTLERQKSIFDFGQFGAIATPSLQGITNIPPLVLQQPPKLPVLKDPILTTGAGAGNPGVMRSYLGSATTIRTALASNVAVSYQGRRVGTASSAATQSRTITDGSAST